MKTTLIFIACAALLASCGPSKEQRITELKTKIDRLKEINIQYLDSSRLLKEKSSQTLIGIMDSILFSNPNKLNKIDDYMDPIRDSVFNSIEPTLKMYATNIESNKAIIKESQAELDKLILK